MQVWFLPGTCKLFQLPISGDLENKALAGRATALDVELFAIRLGVVKATSFDVKHIVIITDSLTAARRAVDTSVHSGQAHSLAII